MTEVQRPGRIGRHELDHHAVAGVCRRRAEARVFTQGGTNHLLACSRGDAQIDEAGSGDLGGIDEAARRRIEVQCADDGLADLARIPLQALGHLQRHVAGEVAMRLDLGPFENDRNVVHAQAGKGLLDQCDDLSFLCGKQGLPLAVRKARILPARCLRPCARPG